MSTIHTLSITFSLPLIPSDLPKFRGAVADSAGWEEDLFHNHAPVQVVPQAVEVTAGDEPQPVEKATLKDSFVYRYPLIHYRVKDGKASIFAINEGVKAVRKWLFQQDGQLRMGGQMLPLLVDDMRERRHDLKMIKGRRYYRLLDYLPLNNENYHRWQEASNYLERVQILQDCLTGHLLGFATAMECRLPERLEVDLMLLRDMRQVILHGKPRLAFHLVMKTNLVLPAEIALGKGISHGYGRLLPTNVAEEEA